MPSSDSEDFQSADEGQASKEKKERKKRLSSSNYSDNALEDQAMFKTPSKSINVENSSKVKETDGWDDFDIEDDVTSNANDVETTAKAIVTNTDNKPQTDVRFNDNRDTGWDDFDDWGQADESSNDVKMDSNNKQKQAVPEPDIKAVTDKMAAASTGGWGWGWSVDSILSTASAGITTLTSQVSQGISTVLETGIGAPDPEEFARKTSKEIDNQLESIEKKTDEKVEKKETDIKIGVGDPAFPFGNLISGVTKFVETTGTKVITGGLDTLETIGKKTMEVLQDGDPGLAKKRAMFGLDSDKPVLSQVLREAKTKADEEDRIREEKREAKEVHYENLFDDFEGLVHLEALEMLSRQVAMRIEERMRGVYPDKRKDIKETLQQVAELCEMPEEEDEDEEESPEDMPKPDALLEKLQNATQDLGLKLQFQHLVKQYTEVLDWLSNPGDTPLIEKAIYKRAVSNLAQATALSVELYHKAAEMLLVKPRRSTADEADALTQMTVVLTRHISELATLFTDKLNSIECDNKEQVNNYITNIFLEAGNSSTYLQNAFQLALPILQIGAV